MGDVVVLGPHERMTPEEALSVAGTYDWERVIISGYCKGRDDLVVMSSHMPRETSLWIVTWLREHILGRL